jgi:hypothetical protein
MSMQHRHPFALIVSSLFVLMSCAREHGDEVAPGGAGKPAAVGGRSAGSAGNGSPDGDDGRTGAKAVAVLKPTIAAASLGADPLTGTAMFSQTVSGVDLTIHIVGCDLGKMYPVFIQEGADCADATLLGAHWDSPRGEGVAPITCTGTSGGGRAFYTRSKRDQKPWTIGRPDVSNLLGHVLVLYDPKSLQPIACGEISRTADVAPVAQPTGGVGPGPEIRAQIAGLCLTRSIVRDNVQACPNPIELDKCASEHCELDACVQQCTDYIACLAKDSAPCSVAFTCPIDDACAQCQSRVSSCVFGFCADQIACAAPVTPDGPCSQLEACCAMQGDDAASCLDTVHLLEKLSGDPSCIGVMQDWDANSHLAVPCKFH